MSAGLQAVCPTCVLGGKDTYALFIFENTELEYATEMLREWQTSGEKVLERLCDLICKTPCWLLSPTQKLLAPWAV